MTEREAYMRRGEIMAGNMYRLRCTHTGVSGGVRIAGFTLSSGRTVIVPQPSCVDFPLIDRPDDVNVGDKITIYCTSMRTEADRYIVWYSFTGLLSSFEISGADAFELEKA